MKRLLSNVLNPALIARIGLVQGLLFGFLGSLCYAQEWVARYNGPANGSDVATAIAVDGSGNVYVTGSSEGSGTSFDYATIKYNSTGAQQWVARYNGPANGYDQAYAIAVDGSGNVYVAGSSDGGSGTASDYTIIKYNPANGETLWVRRYDGPVSRYDVATAIAVDGSGNVYVTGYSEGPGTPFYDYDYATIKYNSSGAQQWVARYNGTADSTDKADAIAVDGSGNVYVTGRSEGPGTSSDYATIKYNSAGVQQWVARYNGPANGYDWAHAIAVDGSGNVYVTGRSKESEQGSGTYFDYTTIKYNSAGAQQWVAKYNGPGNNWDEAYAIAVYGSYVYVTGRSTGSGTEHDYATIKYNSANGETLWVRRYYGAPSGGGDEAKAIAVDGAGNVYVTGSSWLSIPGWTDYATIKYNPANGETLWVRRYDGPANSNDYASAIAVYNSGCVYVTGQSEGSGTSSDYATIKYLIQEGVEERDASRSAQNHRLAVHPNPCFGSAVISYHLPVARLVELAVYDVSGRLVRTLFEEEVVAGSHTVVWNGKDTEGNSVPAGIYFARLGTDQYQAIKKLILIR